MFDSSKSVSSGRPEGAIAISINDQKQDLPYNDNVMDKDDGVNNEQSNNDRNILSCVSGEIMCGKLTAIIGPSGCGTSIQIQNQYFYSTELM